MGRSAEAASKTLVLRLGQRIEKDRAGGKHDLQDGRIRRQQFGDLGQVGERPGRKLVSVVNREEDRRPRRSKQQPRDKRQRGHFAAARDPDRGADHALQFVGLRQRRPDAQRLADEARESGVGRPHWRRTAVGDEIARSPARKASRTN